MGVLVARTLEIVEPLRDESLPHVYEHGDLSHPLGIAGASNTTLRRAQERGIDLDAITAQLEREGVRSFCDSYHELLHCIETKLQRMDRGTSV